ncbi:hypothetical protein FOZ63_017220, partial [Perkinsus olseni]
DAALAAQEALLFWHTGDGSSQFKDAGKSGKVKLAIIPAKGDTMQVVKGTASFGVGELTLEEVVDFLTDVEKKGKYDSQFAQGHKKRALFEDPSTKRRLDLDYAAYKGSVGVAIDVRGGSQGCRLWFPSQLSGVCPAGTVFLLLL